MTDKVEAVTGYFSLADLAAMNTDEVQTLTSRVQPAGLYHVVGISVSGKTRDAVEGKPPLHAFNFTAEILGGTPADPSRDIEGMLKRKLTESYTLWPDQIQDLIGLLKGRYQKVGLQNSGMPLGGVEGAEPGWLDLMVGHEFMLKVRNYTDKNGEVRAGYEWMGPAEGEGNADLETGEVLDEDLNA